MKTTIRRVICLLLVLCMVAAVPAPVLAATSLPNSVYLTQEGYSTCTLCAAAMMIRARMYLNGNSQWSSVTESGIRSVAWVSGMGLRWAFTYELGGDSVTVYYAAASGMSVETLKSILDLHPEGIVLYCGGLPHAVFATDYDGDTFYCAEPVSAYSGKRITLAESWLGHEYGSQATILNNVTAYWYVSKNTSSGTGTGTQTPECNCSANYAGEYICTVGDRLNIRSGHGTGYSAVGSIPSGATVTVTKASGTGSSDWAHVTYNGISGYVSMQYLKKQVQQQTALEITKHPEDVTAALGTTVSMSVEAVGDGLRYQWQWRSANGGSWNITSVSGNTTKTITMEATDGRAGCQYRCVVTDRYGNTAYSASATLTAESGTTACSCSANYAGEYICTVGDSLNIRSGHGTGYSKVGSIPSGATVTVTKASGTGSSDWAHVTYNGVSGYVMMQYLKKQEQQQTALEITKHPEDVTAALGATVSMSVEAVGDGLRYQWQWRSANGGSWNITSVSGNTTKTIRMEVSDVRAGCQYRCVVTDRYGNTAYSESATLTAEGGTSACNCSANYAGEYICKVGDSLNIRSGHGTGYSKVGSIPAGATVTVTKASGTGSGDWAHVTYNGISGYVMMKYLQKPQQTALEITKHPEDVTAALGTTVSMSVEAVGDGLRYQWQRCVSGAWHDLPSEGSRTATLTMGAIVRRNGYQYRCAITDRYGKTVYTDPVQLKVVITQYSGQQRPDSPWRKSGCPAWAAAAMVCRLPPDPAMVTVTDMVMDMVTVMAAVMDSIAATGTDHTPGTAQAN